MRLTLKGWRAVLATLLIPILGVVILTLLGIWVWSIPNLWVRLVVAISLIGSLVIGVQRWKHSSSFHDISDWYLNQAREAAPHLKRGWEQRPNWLIPGAVMLLLAAMITHAVRKKISLPHFGDVDFKPIGWVLLAIGSLWLIIWGIRKLVRRKPTPKSDDTGSKTGNLVKTKSWSGPPWQVQILLIIPLATMVGWTIVSWTFGSRDWWMIPTCIFLFVLLLFAYWVRWDAVGVQTRTTSGGGNAITPWFVRVIVLVVVLGMVVGSKLIYDWAIHDKEMTTRINPVAAVTAVKLGIIQDRYVQDPQDGLGQGRPDDIQILTDSTLVWTIRPSATWLSGGIELNPDEVVIKDTPDSVFTATIPGLGRRVFTLSGLSDGQRIMPSDIPDKNIKDTCPRTSQPLGALLYRWDDTMGHFMGSGRQAYAPAARKHRVLRVTINLPTNAVIGNGDDDRVVITLKKMKRP